MRITIFVGLFLATSLVASANMTGTYSDGKVIYESKCGGCHGVDAKGSPRIATMMKIDPDLLDLTNERNKDRTDTEIVKVVREGQGKMRPIANDRVSDADLGAAISHLRKLQDPSR